jgi:hypothetical protein
MERPENGWERGALTQEVGGEAGELDKDGDEAETTRYSPESTTAASGRRLQATAVKTNVGSVSRTERRHFRQK